MENNSKKQASKRTFNFSGLLAVILAVLLLAIVIPINLIVQYFDFKIDTTPSKMYTLTDKSIELLDSVKDKQIEMYVLAPGVDDIEDFAEDDMALSLYYALKQYDEYDNIKITCFDPEERPELVEKLNSGSLYKLSSGTIFVKCGDFTHKITGIWNEITDSDGNVIESKYLGEDLIAGAIKTVTAGDIANIYFLTGHGEKTIDNYNFFKSETKNRNYDLLELNLSAEDAVPDDARIIFICAPQKDITLNEQEKLMDYLENGNITNSVNYPNTQLGVCQTQGRISILHRNIPNMLTRFTGAFAKDNINITEMSNKTKGDYAYAIFDVDSQITEESVQHITDIEGVLKVRVIK